MASSNNVDLSMEELNKSISETNLNENPSGEPIITPYKVSISIESIEEFEKRENIEETIIAIFQEQINYVEMIIRSCEEKKYAGEDLNQEEENVRFEINFAIFKKMVAESFLNFIKTHKTFFENERKKLAPHFANICAFLRDVKIIMLQLFVVEHYDFYFYFPLFKFLTNMYKNNHYVIAQHVWKIAILDTFNERSDKWKKYNIIVVQSIKDHLVNFDTEFNKKVEKNEDGRIEREIVLKEENYRSFFSGHIYLIENWISSKSALFKTLTLPAVQCNIPKPFDVNFTLDVFTYTLLMMFDKEKEKNHIGGFKDIPIIKGNSLFSYDYISLSKTIETFKKTNPDASPKDIEKMMKTKIGLLTARCEFFISNDSALINDLFSQFFTICWNIQKVETVEQKEYEEFMRNNPDIEKMKNDLES